MAGLLVLTAVLTAGCTHNAEAHPQNAAESVPSPTRWPAATEGGACYLLAYDVIEQLVGVSFDVAASSQAGDTFTCVLQQNKGASYPDLTLSVTPTAADPAVFTATVRPKSATPVAGLGLIGYQFVRPAAADAGPAVEVGWLSGNERLLVLRYRGPAAAGAADTAALVPKMVALAKKVDQNSL
jgi:hypothetical protein